MKPLIRGGAEALLGALSAGRLTRVLRQVVTLMRITAGAEWTTAHVAGAAVRQAEAGSVENARRLLDVVREYGRENPAWVQTALSLLPVLGRWDEVEKVLPPLDLSLSLLAAGRVDDALAAWRKAVDREAPAGDVHVPVLLNAAEALIGGLDERDEREAASAVLDSVRSSVSERQPQRLVGVTRLALRTGRPRSAVAAAEALATALPTTRNFALLAEALQRARQYEESLEVLERATALAPESAHLHAARAEALAVESRFEEAIAAYERALTAEERPRWLSSLGKLQARVGRDDDALATFRRRQELRPTDTAAEWIERLETRLGGGGSVTLPRDADPDRMFLHLVDLVDAGAESAAEAQLAEWLRPPDPEGEQ